MDCLFILLAVAAQSPPHPNDRLPIPKQDVSTFLSVPTDSLKRVTRERKYAIEETSKCLEESKRTSSSSGGAVGTADLMRELKALRQRFAETYEQEKACIRRLQARIEYVTGNVLEKERERSARRGDRASTASEGRQVTIGNAVGKVAGRVVGNGASTCAAPPTITSYVDVLVQEYVARQGHSDTLRTLQRPDPDFLPLLIDVEQYEELNRLVASIEERHSCAEALAWCGKNAAKLKKMRSALVFQLHVQEFVRILDGGESGSGGGEGGPVSTTTTVSEEVKRRAMAYARRYLSPYAGTYPDEFQRAAGLLVLRDILPEASSCTELFAGRRWHDISSLLRRDYFSIHGLSPTSPLETHLKCGIAALQVSINDQSERGAANGGAVGGPNAQRSLVPQPPGASEHGTRMDVDSAQASQPSRSNIMHGRVIQQNDDPLRHPVIKRLAAAVPSSKRTVSKLVCPVTSIVMEGNNEPVALPNGYVYGSLAVYGGLLDSNTDEKDGDGQGAPSGTAMTATEPAVDVASVSSVARDSNRVANHGDDTRRMPRRPSDRLAKQILCPCTGDAYSIDLVRKLYVV